MIDEVKSLTSNCKDPLIAQHAAILARERGFTGTVYRATQYPDSMKSAAILFEGEDGEVVIKAHYGEGEDGFRALSKEKRLTGLIRETFPDLPVPEYLETHEKLEGFPSAVAIMRKLDGTQLTQEAFLEIGGTPANIRQLCHYVQGIHRVTDTEIPLGILTNYIDFQGDMTQYVFEHVGKMQGLIVDNPELLEFFNINKHRFNSIPQRFGKNRKHVLIHRDLKWNNILFAEGKISGIVDFGAAMIGPEALEFSLTGALSTVYNYEGWYRDFMETYLKEYSENPDELGQDIIAFRSFFAMWVLSTRHRRNILGDEKDRLKKQVEASEL